MSVLAIAIPGAAQALVSNSTYTGKETTLKNGMGLAVIGFALTWGTGCADRPVERVPVPAAGNRDLSRVEYDEPKPLPDQSQYWASTDELPPPPFEDVPLVTQRTPEQGRFERAYREIGKPRIAVFVNRTLEGEIVQPIGSRRRGYDEARAKAVDYEAMENILTDFLACQGSVEIMSPTLARQKLTDEQVKDLESGRPRVLREIAQQLEADILIQVTAKPTRQTAQGLEVRLVGEAMNIKGGQQVGRAVVDIPPPLEKTTLNRYTRFVARKLMTDLTQAWMSMEPAEKQAPKE
jgi:hypothetical protein